MSEIVHTLETELIEQVLTEQPDFVAVLDDLAQRYGLPARHVLLVSNYLQKDLPPGVPAGMDKLLELCQEVKQGRYRVDTLDGDLVLYRENGNGTSTARTEIPAAAPQEMEAPASAPRSRALSLAFGLAALAALAAAGYFLYRYLGQ